MSLCWGVVAVQVAVRYTSQTGGSCPKLCPWTTSEGLDRKALSSLGPAFRRTAVLRIVWSLRHSELSASFEPSEDGRQSDQGGLPVGVGPG